MRKYLILLWQSVEYAKRMLGSLGLSANVRVFFATSIGWSSRINVRLYW